MKFFFKSLYEEILKRGHFYSVKFLKVCLFYSLSVKTLKSDIFNA